MRSTYSLVALMNLVKKLKFQRSVPICTPSILLKSISIVSHLYSLYLLQDGNIPNQVILTKVFVSQHTYQITLKGGLFVKCLRGRLSHDFYSE